MVELETKNGKMVKTLDTLYDEYVDGYLQGNFTEGLCHWNGDDALMSPMSFGKRFGDYCHRLGYDASEYEGHMNELIEGTWGASMHEESHQITKDTIYKMGGIK